MMDDSLTVSDEEEEKGRKGEKGMLGISSSSPFPPLPSFSIPFVVKPDYKIRSDLVKMPVELFGQLHDKHFIFDEQYFTYVAAKLEQLQRHPELCHVYANGYDETNLIECANIIFRKLAEEHPEYVSVDGDVVVLHLLGLRLNLETSEMKFIDVHLEGGQPSAPTKDKLLLQIYEHLKNQNILQRLWDCLALAVQEDLVIVRDNGEMGVSELMHVCLPSHWNPGERVGQSLYGLHQPVANSEQLLKASKNTLQAMVNKGPFVRFVWSLNSTDELNLNPTFHTHGRKKPLGDDPSQWFFRVERQTTLPIPELKRSLFTIRILVAPLPSVLTEERKNLLVQAVLSMDEKLLAYKGLVKQKDVLLEYLQR
jgi:hypothetical protein